jgi:hypothetical protein
MSPLYNEIIPNLFIGCFEARYSSQFQAIVTISSLAELKCYCGPQTPREPIDNILFIYHSDESPGLFEYFDDAVEFIATELDKGNKVLVHCGAGISRSPTIVAAYLMKKKGMRFEDIVTLFLDKRPIIYMSPIFIKELKEIK